MTIIGLENQTSAEAAAQFVDSLELVDQVCAQFATALSVPRSYVVCTATVISSRRLGDDATEMRRLTASSSNMEMEFVTTIPDGSTTIVDDVVQSLFGLSTTDFESAVEAGLIDAGFSTSLSLSAVDSIGDIVVEGETVTTTTTINVVAPPEGGGTSGASAGLIVLIIIIVLLCLLVPLILFLIMKKRKESHGGGDSSFWPFGSRSNEAAAPMAEPVAQQPQAASGQQGWVDHDV